MSGLKFGNGYSSISFGNNRKVVFFVDPANLADWRYEVSANGQIQLQEYLGDWNSTVYVPRNAVINMYGSLLNTPFYNNPSVKRVDLQGVPFVSNDMFEAFQNCTNLTSVTGINSNVYRMYYTFHNCTNFNQNIQIPNSVTDMVGTFYGCSNLNQNIQIPNSVTNMSETFYYCEMLSSNITILSGNVTNAMFCFASPSSLPKNVYIPYTYSNGVNSATFNAFVSAGYLYSSGASTGLDGVTMHDIVTEGTPIHDGGDDDIPDM